MADIYHNGNIIGSNLSIDDSQVGDKTTWSSEKISGEIGEVEDRVEALENGWSSLEVLHEETYGVLRGCVNTKLKIANIIWSGNANSAPSGTIRISIPDKYTPIISVIAPLKCGSMGHYMEVRVDKRVDVNLPNESWCACNIFYHTI